MRTIVIGGGITGLVAAHRLRQGSHVTLLEAAGSCGGHVMTAREAGFVVEAGPNGFLDRDREPEPMALLRELGLEGALVQARPSAKRRFVLRGGRLRLVPASPVSLLASDVLSPAGKLRLAMEPFIPPAAGGAGETVHAFATRRLGSEAADVLVDAAVSGISAGDSRALDVAAAFPQMPAMEREHGSLLKAMLARRERPPRLVSFAGGMQALTGALVERLCGAMRLRARAVRVEREAGIWRVTLCDRRVFEAERLVLAIGASHAAKLFRDFDPGLARALAGFPHAGLAVVAMAFRESDVPRALDGYGYLATRDEGMDTLGVVWESSLFEGRAPAGHVLLRAMLGGARRPDLAHLDEAALAARARAELSHVMGIRVPPVRTWVWRWPRAITQYTCGHLERVAHVRALAAQHPGLELCGTSYDGISFTAAILSAERAAARVLAPPASSPEPAPERSAPDPLPPQTDFLLTETARAV